jgi:hypothetical protein
MEAQVDAFEPNLPALLIFAAAWAACCIGGIHLAGMLPLSSAPAAVRSRGWAALVTLNGVLLAALLALTVAFSYRELRWSSAVVVGGAIFLFAPLAVQDLPERIRDGKAGLVLLVVMLLLALALLFLGGAPSGIIALNAR